jgi:hypothetical protein
MRQRDFSVRTIRLRELSRGSVARAYFAGRCSPSGHSMTTRLFLLWAVVAGHRLDAHDAERRRHRGLGAPRTRGTPNDDHRIAMSFAIAGDVELRDPGWVGNTFTGYFDQLARRG